MRFADGHHQMTDMQDNMQGGNNRLLKGPGRRAEGPCGQSYLQRHPAA